jgi:hypothetical protein
MKNIKQFLFITFIGFGLFVQAQNKVILQEHFTNTLCSVCASRNPGLYTNIRTQQDVLHVSYYPSSPYPACILNQHNKTENDARTNFYGVYGSTPRIVLNGVVQPSSTNYASVDIFTPFKSIAADLSISIQQTLESDLIKSKVWVKRLTNKLYSNLKLQVMYVEDTLFYNAPNGESQHYDVFRKSANGIQGIDINLPSNIGDSILLLSQTAINSAWNKNRIYTLAFVQDGADKTILNTAKSATNKLSSSGIKNLSDLGIKVYPNPATAHLNIELSNNENTNVSLINILGELVLFEQLNNSKCLEISSLNKGLYFLEIENSRGKSTQKIIIK